eukprot:TRINITY_DN69865_c0_g1_i1.p1 TRINITY_DN69865_c0_g1~~TRINITY_DN69865_c0_g1_i1.p1  ORF type:complete len:507 (+),score=77.58 TRINITY_DN69865_c0_g1_i1:174-1694(+)
MLRSFCRVPFSVIRPSCIRLSSSTYTSPRQEVSCRDPRWQQQVFYDPHVADLASRPLKPLDPAEVLRFGRRAGGITPLRVASIAPMIRLNVAVRLAQSIRLFHMVPFLVATNPHFHTVFHAVWDSFHAIRSLPATATTESAAALRDALVESEGVHQHTLLHLRAGLAEVLRLPTSVGLDVAAVDDFLHRFLQARFARYVVVENFVAMCHQAQLTSPATPELTAPPMWRPAAGGDGRAHIGCINAECCVGQIARAAAAHVTATLPAAGGVSPNVEVVGDIEATVAFNDLFLFHSIVEVVRNAVAATAETYGAAVDGAASSEVPGVVVRVSVTGGSAMVTVSDAAGGPRFAQAGDGFHFCRPTLEGASSQRMSVVAAGDPAERSRGERLAIADPTRFASSIRFVGASGDAGVGTGGATAGGLVVSDAADRPFAVCGPIVSTAHGEQCAATGDVEKSGDSGYACGFGLPTAYLMMSVLGGTVRVEAMPGYGTDAYVAFRSLDAVDGLVI